MILLFFILSAKITKCNNLCFSQWISSCMFLNNFYKIFNILINCNQSTISRSFPNMYYTILQYSLEQLLNKEIISVHEKISFGNLSNIEETSLFATQLYLIYILFFVLSKIQKWMGLFWDDFIANKIFVLWNSYQSQCPIV